ncbi:MAG: glycosyltransferase family 4 protein [Candidatus Aegiribacteria sp.]|nr:glycosyltransferase family 4 protein [Candidatus Aegiribacteria sp.]
MRISVLATDSVPNIGGIADYLNGLMSSTVNEIQWNLKTTAPGSPEEDHLLPYPVHHFSVSTRRLGDHFGDGFAPVRKLNTLRWLRYRRKEDFNLVKKTVEEDNPDAILFPRWTESSHPWFQACVDMGIQYIIIAFGLEIVMPVSSKMETARKSDFAKAALVYADSHFVADLVRILAGEDTPVLVLNPGVTPEKMETIPEELAASTIQGIGLEDRFILAMGRLVHRKGFDLAVEAFDRIAEDWPEVDLVVAGDGDDRREVEVTVENSRNKDRIRMLGRISEREKHALFQKCEFYVMPNRPVEEDIEGFGIVFLEANYYGKAVIGGNNGGVCDAIEHEETGLLVDIPDTVALAEAMERLLKDRDLASAYGRTGRERVLNDFQWSHLSQIFLRGIDKYLRG